MLGTLLVFLASTRTRSMLQTDQRYPSIGNDNSKVVVNPDTSVDVWFGPTAPEGHVGLAIETSIRRERVGTLGPGDTAVALNHSTWLRAGSVPNESRASLARKAAHNVQRL